MQNKMTLAAYQEAAQRTFAHLADIETDCLHMVLGLTTEAGELCDIFKKELAYGKPIDMTNLKEEIGDSAWYYVNLATINNIALEEPEGFEEEIRSLVFDTLQKDDICHYRIVSKTATNAGKAYETFDQLSRHVLWGLFSQDLFADVITAGIKHLMVICLVYDISFEECLYLNIAKLKVRFPEEFTSEAALARDLGKERKALEDKKISLENYPLIENDEGKPRVHYVRHPVKQHTGKWVGANVKLDGALVPIVSYPFDNEEECQMACDEHNQFHGWSKDFVDYVVNISMKSSIANESY